ncbi:hypothetical protein LguiA_028881 [Lonicera macranthoides]
MAAGVEGSLVLIGQEVYIEEHKIGSITAITTICVTFFVIALLINNVYSNSSWSPQVLNLLLSHRPHNSAATSVEDEDDREVEMECVVCLCHISSGEKYRVLSECKHGFHVECINGWLKDHPTCPLCRTHISLLHQDDRNFCPVLVSYIVSFWDNFWRWMVNPLSSDFMSALCQDCNSL